MDNNKTTTVDSSLSQTLDMLKPVAERVAIVDMTSGNFFPYFVSASIVKTFEFVELVIHQEASNAYFLASTLRGIAEEIIYLHFLSQFDHKTREEVLLNMMHLEVARQLHIQETFFEKFRPFQAVLSSSGFDTKEARKQLKTFWDTNGLTVGRDNRPRTVDIAKKSSSAHLHVVYNFIFRFTSGFVHFNPQAMMRSGWGDPHNKAVFSTKNMGDYYLETSLVYGCYLLCLQFEIFEELFDLSQAEKDSVRKLREYLLYRPRWPEIVTFEEMNQALPQISPIAKIAVQIAFNKILEDGFISGTEKIVAQNRPQKN